MGSIASAMLLATAAFKKNPTTRKCSPSEIAWNPTELA